jgi:hypothetical protein
VSQVANLPGYYEIPNEAGYPSLIAHDFSNVLSTMRLSSLVDITKALHITRPQPFPMHPHMEIRFELATEPAVKGPIAVVSCVSIAYLATHARKWYRISCALLIGIISVLIGTDQMPPLCASHS